MKLLVSVGKGIRNWQSEFDDDPDHHLNPGFFKGSFIIMR